MNKFFKATEIFIKGLRTVVKTSANQSFFSPPKKASAILTARQHLFFSSEHSGETIFPFQVNNRILNGSVDTTKTFRASLRNISKDMRREFAKGFFIAPISIGQNVHEDGYMLATIKLLKKYFKGGIFLIDDTLQEYTFRIKYPNASQEEIYKRCLDDGQQWIDKYSPYFNHFMFETMRWNDLRNDPKFKECLKLVKDFKKSNAEYATAFERNIFEFLGRLMKKDPTIDFDLAHKLCEQYLEEECAGMLLWMNKRVTVECYPNHRNHAMEATNKLLIPILYNGDTLPIATMRFKQINKSNQLEDGNNNQPPKCSM